MRRALVVLAACGSAKPSPAPTPAPEPTPVHAAAPADAPAAKQEEILAAIQKAMNDLAPAANACWARAATERFDIEGEYEAAIDVGDHDAQVADANVRAIPPSLVACMHDVLAHYTWAPPLHGQSIRLPFKWTAPGGQSVIDRQLVEAHAQGKIAISVLLDENNTGNEHASMFDVAIQAGGTTGMRLADRAELWYFLGAAKVTSAGHCQAPASHVETDHVVGHAACTGGVVSPVTAGDMAYVPKGIAREVAADRGDVHAVVVVVPGGREGAARAGALPTPTAERSSDKGEVIRLKADKAKKFGPATIYLDDSLLKGTPMAGEILELPAGANVPEHAHANETELLYVLEGSGTMTIAGTQVPITPTSVVQIPPNTKHSFAGKDAVRALQVYTPAGPEQRFKKK